MFSSVEVELELEGTTVLKVMEGILERATCRPL